MFISSSMATSPEALLLLAKQQQLLLTKLLKQYNSELTKAYAMRLNGEGCNAWELQKLRSNINTVMADIEQIAECYVQTN